MQQRYLKKQIASMKCNRDILRTKQSLANIADIFEEQNTVYQM